MLHGFASFMGTHPILESQVFALVNGLHQLLSVALLSFGAGPCQTITSTLSNSVEVVWVSIKQDSCVLSQSESFVGLHVSASEAVMERSQFLDVYHSLGSDGSGVVTLLIVYFVKMRPGMRSYLIYYNQSEQRG
jgi:hypothetical protein